MNHVKYFCDDGWGCLMRRLLSLRVQGFRKLCLELGIQHLSFLGLWKGTDPFYAVIRSSYTLYYYVHVELYVLHMR